MQTPKINVPVLLCSSVVQNQSEGRTKSGSTEAEKLINTISVCAPCAGKLKRQQQASEKLVGQQRDLLVELQTEAETFHSKN